MQGLLLSGRKSDSLEHWLTCFFLHPFRWGRAGAELFRFSPSPKERAGVRVDPLGCFWDKNPSVGQKTALSVGGGPKRGYFASPPLLGRGPG